MNYKNIDLTLISLHWCIHNFMLHVAYCAVAYIWTLFSLSEISYWIWWNSNTFPHQAKVSQEIHCVIVYRFISFLSQSGLSYNVTMRLSWYNKDVPHQLTTNEFTNFTITPLMNKRVKGRGYYTILKVLDNIYVYVFTVTQSSK